ncbi:MAG: O-antigen ligase family protein [Deltaproteobacteria bacterium]|uniref:O-antigen ligase family protein n=1 Tax=Desulfobacula sp. TaxID=2593537 RepID=UPI0019A25149|nr:O-antigen ligase family protein [Candidatus Desulfobacula maris]MBL6992769.1 O-antigen ligase family protein [Desulfobacula sp.]
MKKDTIDNFKFPFFNIRDVNFGIVLISIYFLLEFGSFHGLHPLTKQLNLPFLTASLTMLYAFLLVVKGDVDFKSKTTLYFTIFWIFIILYTLAATKGKLVKEDLIKHSIIYWSNYIVIICSVKKKSQFILLLDVWLVSVLLSCYHASMQGGLIWGNRWLKDENHISLVAATALPFAMMFFVVHKSKIKKFCYVLCLFGYVTANVIAHSRGGTLSLGLALFLCFVLMKHKIRNAIIIIALIIVGLSYAPPDFHEEMATLQQGTEESTASDRIYLWGIAMEMFYDHPLVGVGPLNYPIFFSSYDKGTRYEYMSNRVAHSTPLQYLAETGVVGLLFFLSFQVPLWQNWRAVVWARKPKIPTYFVLIAHACFISQISFHFGSLFLTLLPYPFYWCLVPFSETWKNICEKGIAEGGNE